MRENHKNRAQYISTLGKNQIKLVINVKNWLSATRTRLIHIIYKGKGKGKVVSVRAIKVYTGAKAYSSVSSLPSSAIDGGEWSALRPDRFTPDKRAPFTNLIADWVRIRIYQDPSESGISLSPPCRK
jgi:hypothetical protein